MIRNIFNVKKLKMNFQRNRKNITFLHKSNLNIFKRYLGIKSKNNSRKETLLLYKLGLDLFKKELEFQPGDNIDKVPYIRNLERLNYDKRKHEINKPQREYGASAASIYKLMFKMNKNLKNKDDIDKAKEYCYQFIQNPYPYLLRHCRESLKMIYLK